MKTIVEVGAHTGKETLNFLTDIEAQVYAFEPEAQTFRELYQKSRAYSRLTVLPFAVDIGDNQEPLFHYGDGGSTLQPAMIGRAHYTMVWTIRMDTFMALYSIDKIDYLRIDAPYREEMILESLAERIHNVQGGRITMYQPDSPVVTLLYDNGFNVKQDITSDNVMNPDLRFWR